MDQFRVHLELSADCRREKKRGRQGKEKKGNKGRENGVKRVDIKIILENSKKRSLLKK